MIGVNSDTDLNTIITAGVYHGTSSAAATNGPTATFYWTMEVYVARTARIIQFFKDQNANTQWKRTSTDTGANWSIWQRDDTGVVLDWAASTGVVLGELRKATVAVGGFVVGQLIRSNSLRTTTATFDATEALLWADATIGKADTAIVSANEVSMQRVHEKAFIKTPFLAHPVDFTAATRVGSDGTYTATASSEFSGTYAVWKLFDGTTADWATSGITNIWAALQFPVAKIITRVLAQGRAASTEDILTWRIEASNDGTTWTTLHTSANAISDTLLTEDFVNTKAYTRYRLFGITATGPNAIVNRLEFHESVYSPSSISSAVVNTEYISPEQHGSIYGTVYRQYFGATLPASLTSGNTVTKLVDSYINVHNGSNRYSIRGWSSDGSSSAWVILSGISGAGNLSMTLGGTFTTILGGWVDYTK